MTHLFTTTAEADQFAAGLGTRTIGRNLRFFPQIGSTNDVIRQAAQQGTAEGLVAITDEQTAGRGRQGRQWRAPPGSSLLMSVLLRPTWLAPESLFALTMLAGVALCEAAEDVAPLRAQMKWPNDLLLSTATTPARKAAGVLSEAHMQDGRVAWVVLGMGTNVNWQPHGTIDGRDLASVATSVSAVAGRTIDRRELCAALLQRLDAGYATLRDTGPADLFATWRTRLHTLGQRIDVRLANGVTSGYAENVDADGTLLLRRDDGALQRITAGDVGG